MATVNLDRKRLVVRFLGILRQTDMTAPRTAIAAQLADAAAIELDELADKVQSGGDRAPWSMPLVVALLQGRAQDLRGTR